MKARTVTSSLSLEVSCTLKMSKSIELIFYISSMVSLLIFRMSSTTFSSMKLKDIIAWPAMISFPTSVVRLLIVLVLLLTESKLIVFLLALVRASAHSAPSLTLTDYFLSLICSLICLLSCSTSVSCPVVIILTQ